MGCLDKHCVHNDIQTLEQHCIDNGIKLTPLRKQVLQAVCASAKPLSAYALLDILNSDTSGEKKLQSMSLYRVLNFLQENNLIHRVESLNAYVLCHRLQSNTSESSNSQQTVTNSSEDSSQESLGHLSQLLICNDCGDVTECDLPDFHQIVDGINCSTGFSVKSPVIEFSGTCSDCQVDNDE